MVKFDFSHSKLRKQPFLLKFSKSRGSKTPPCIEHEFLREIDTTSIINKFAMAKSRNSILKQYVWVCCF